MKNILPKTVVRHLRGASCFTLLFVASGIVWAQSADVQRAIDAYNEGDYAAAMAVWEPLANQGNRNAQFAMGVLYSEGHGVNKNLDEALAWFRKAADSEHPTAMFNLGVAYWEGRGLSQSFAQAVDWWERAAESGDVASQYNLGLAYYLGKGVQKDLDQARNWLTQAAEKGHTDAQRVLGIIDEHWHVAAPTPTPTPEPDDAKIVAATSGTGFFVSPSGHVITNHHVIEDCKAVKVSFKGNEVDANVLSIDRYNDLAILKTALKPNKVFPVSGEDAALLDDVVIAGFPLGKDVSSAIKTSKGSVTSLAGYGDNYSEFQTDAALNQGNSGGPIMNQKGNVIGVAVSAYGKQEGVESFNFGIKASTLKTFAQSNSLTLLPPNSRDLSNSELGQLITNATLYLECWMTVAKIKQLIAKEGNRKAFFSEFQ